MWMRQLHQRHARRWLSAAALSPRRCAQLEEEGLALLRATPTIDPALVAVSGLAVRPDGHVACSLEFASGACAQREAIEGAAREALLGTGWAEGCTLDTRLRSPTSFMGIKAPPSLQHVGSLIGISSCKGGVGKSTVAVNLAFALARMGGRVGLLDADVHGPSLPSLVTLPEDSLPLLQAGDSKLIQPPQVGGVRLMSYGYLAKGASTGRVPAAIMRGPMVGQVVGQMLSGTAWGELDYLLVDLPPGTGDVQLTLSQTYGLTAAVVVTTPQRLARVDVEKGIDMFTKLGVPIAALIENMAFFKDGYVSHARLEPAPLPSPQRRTERMTPPAW
jgi:Mrp family chromosome partitioning ATPase